MFVDDIIAALARKELDVVIIFAHDAALARGTQSGEEGLVAHWLREFQTDIRYQMEHELREILGDALQSLTPEMSAAVREKLSANRSEPAVEGVSP